MKADLKQKTEQFIEVKEQVESKDTYKVMGVLENVVMIYMAIEHKCDACNKAFIISPVLVRKRRQ